MTENGYKRNSKQVDQKWQNLLMSHKKIMINKAKTVGRRKTFQYFESMDNIVHKRHDINPPYVAGSGVRETTPPPPPSKTLKMAPISASSPKSSIEFSDDDEDVLEAPSAILSTSASAIRRRQIRKVKAEENDSQLQTLSFLKDIQQERKQLP